MTRRRRYAYPYDTVELYDQHGDPVDLADLPTLEQLIATLTRTTDVGDYDRDHSNHATRSTPSGRTTT